MTSLSQTDIHRLFSELGAKLVWEGEEFRSVDDIAQALRDEGPTPQNLPGEEWSPIEGFAGRYSISNLARIRRDAPGKGTRPGRILKSYTGNHGYKQVRLTPENGGKSAVYMIHRLMALTFIPNPEDLPIVRHLNDLPWDNRIENLAWGTQSDNMFDVTRNGNHFWANRSECSKGHPLSGDNLQIRSDSRGVSRRCVVCDKARKRKWYEESKRKSLGLKEET